MAVSGSLTTLKPLNVWITKKLWKILQEMGIPEHLTCLLRNIYAGQKATVSTGHEATDWFQIRKGVCQSCILLPWLFNLHTEFSYQIRSLSRVRLFVTPWIAACQASLSITNSLSSTRLISHRVSDAIQPSHPLSSPSPPAPNPSHHQSLFQWVNSSHEVAKVLEFQLQHHSFQRNPRDDLLQNGLVGSPRQP